MFASETPNSKDVRPGWTWSRLLRMLKPAQRQVLEMAYLEDMPELEIAETLGTTVAWQ